MAYGPVPVYMPLWMPLVSRNKATASRSHKNESAGWRLPSRGDGQGHECDRIGLVRVPHVVLMSGWTGAGKSTVANAIAIELGCTVASFDWLMSGIRAFPDVWATVELPVEKQRSVGWTLMSRVAEQGLRRDASLVFDLVAREEARREWQTLAESYGAAFSVVECVCSDLMVHRARVEERSRSIPGWYELSWEQVERGRKTYLPLAEPKLVIDAVNPLSDNIEAVLRYIDTRSPS